MREKIIFQWFCGYLQKFCIPPRNFAAVCKTFGRKVSRTNFQVQCFSEKCIIFGNECKHSWGKFLPRRNAKLSLMNVQLFMQIFPVPYKFLEGIQIFCIFSMHECKVSWRIFSSHLILFPSPCL